jgi:hypothetical protein
MMIRVFALEAGGVLRPDEATDWECSTGAAANNRIAAAREARTRTDFCDAIDIIPAGSIAPEAHLRKHRRNTIELIQEGSES